MTMRTILPALAVLALAGCNGQQTASPAGNDDSAEANAVVDNGEAGNNVAAQVVAMSERMRNVVFIRAIRDANLPCEHVDSSERLPDQNGLPLWRANCKPGGSHMITITPDGTAKIISRSDDR